MRVLHLSNTPLSNAPSNLATCQNYYGTDATLLLHQHTNKNGVRVGVRGALWSEFKKDELANAMETADVLHFHNFAREQKIFVAYPSLWSVAEKKPKLIQYHSPRHTTENFETTIQDKTMKHAVIAQYHVRVYPECEFIVPNVIPLFLPEYSPMPGKWQEGMAPTISYAPSNINMKGWDNKGYAITKQALQEAERENWATSDIIVNTDYAQCIQKKKWAHVGIDEVVTGSYHLSGLEYLAMGCVTVGFLDTLTQAALKTVLTQVLDEMQAKAALQTLPWIQVHERLDLKAILYELLVGQDRAGRYIRWQLLKERATLSREWMEKYWHPENHVRWFNRIYEQL